MQLPSMHYQLQEVMELLIHNASPNLRGCLHAGGISMHFMNELLVNAKNLVSNSIIPLHW